METMDFKVNRETFVANRTVLDSSCEQAIERDFVLPDYNPDIFRILKCCVIPRVVSHSINGEKLTFELSVLIRVLYQSEGSSKVNCLEQKISYSKSVDLNGECQNPVVKIIPRTDYVNCRVVNQRRLDVRGAVSARVKVVGEKKQQVVTDAKGGNIQLKKSLVTYPSKRLTSAKRVTVIEDLELGEAKPPVDAVIRTDCNVFPSELKIIAGKLVTKGDAEISMLYTCTDDEGNDSVETMRFAIPFSQIVDVDGIDDGYEAFVDICPAGCDIMPKGENGTELECELVMLVNCTAVKYDTCEVVCDAYSTCYECEMENSDCRIDSMPVNINDTHSTTTQISYNEEEIKCIYDVWCDTDNISSRFDEENNKFVISGNVRFSLMGKNESECPVYLETDTAFEHDVELSENCKGENSYVEPKICVKNCSYHMIDGNTVEAKAELQIGGYLYEACARTMLSDLKVCTDKPKDKKAEYALKLCYCNGEEDIWEIAKKYSTSINAILEENDLEEDKSDNYGMLLIPLIN